MEPTCINLKREFGDRFKVAYEESYAAERGNHARAEDPWLMVILCQHGEIYPYGDDLLVASTKKAGSIARTLKALPYVSLYREGFCGSDLIFPLDQFEAVAAIMKPRKRRRLSEAARRRAADRLRKYQFTKNNLGATAAVQSENRA